MIAELQCDDAGHEREGVEAMPDRCACDGVRRPESDAPIAAAEAFGGPNDRVVAAVLVYRVMSVLPTLAFGLVAAGVSRRTR